MHCLYCLHWLNCLQVLQEMLDMLRDHQQNHHSVRLEWIIIWLIAGVWGGGSKWGIGRV